VTSVPREHAERIIECFPHLREDDHHRLCNTRSGDDCDCYARRFQPARESFAALLAALSELDQARACIADNTTWVESICFLGFLTGWGLEGAKRRIEANDRALAGSDAAAGGLTEPDSVPDADGSDPGTPGVRQRGTAVPAQARPGSVSPEASFPHLLPRRILIDQAGYVWRDFGDSLSMCPGNPDNEPVPDPCAVYVLAGFGPSFDPDAAAGDTTTGDEA
jgi:hypothetical protein